jgi:hypothetical protein
MYAQLNAVYLPAPWLVVQLRYMHDTHMYVQACPPVDLDWQCIEYSEGTCHLLQAWLALQNRTDKLRL